MTEVRHFYEETARRHLAERPSLAYVDILARRARAGDAEAMSELCEALAGIAEALSVTHRVALVARNRGLDRDDLRQEAMCAMLDALKKWKPAESAFRTYAFNTARYAILNAINNGHAVSVPRSIAHAAHSGNWGGLAHTDRARDQARAAIGATLSIDARPTDDEEGRYPAEEWLGEVERDYEDVMTRMVLRQAFGRARHLKDRERRALVMHFGLDGREPITFRAMAEEFGLSMERSRQIRLRALKRLRMAVGVSR